MSWVVLCVTPDNTCLWCLWCLWCLCAVSSQLLPQNVWALCHQGIHHGALVQLFSRLMSTCCLRVVFVLWESSEFTKCPRNIYIYSCPCSQHHSLSVSCVDVVGLPDEVAGLCQCSCCCWSCPSAAGVCVCAVCGGWFPGSGDQEDLWVWNRVWARTAGWSRHSQQHPPASATNYTQGACSVIINAWQWVYCDIWLVPVDLWCLPFADYV